ncbi:MAG: heparinase II/III family protein, partial [Eubacteriaceae bacterium]|nr:heparinase II/III family protein [Eubacteriaceae bacterium]
PFFFSGKQISGLKRGDAERLAEVKDCIPDTDMACFSFLYDVIRCDFHSGKDCSRLVFDRMVSFLDGVNGGLSEKDARFTGLQMLNWTFALYYYMDSPLLTEELFERIMRSFYARVRCVYRGVWLPCLFSRNVSPVVEALFLYVVGLLFPFLPDSARWMRVGKRRFEREIAGLIEEDGTCPYFSMPGLRMVAQLLTWGIRLGELNHRPLAPVVYERARQCLRFWDVCVDPVSGWMPNMGLDDEVTFLNLTGEDARDFRPTLDDLRVVLSGKAFRMQESFFWYGLPVPEIVPRRTEGAYAFENGGYYVVQEKSVKTFMTCRKSPASSAPADLLQLDIWADGVNVLMDMGTCDCEGNTLAPERRCKRRYIPCFLRLFRQKQGAAEITGTSDEWVLEGAVRTFCELKQKIMHRRKVIKKMGENCWEVHDRVRNVPRKEKLVHWHLNPLAKDRVTIVCEDCNGWPLSPLVEERPYISGFGMKDVLIRMTFSTFTSGFNTKIVIQE